MSTAPTLSLLIAAGGLALLGSALAIGLISTRKRRQNPIAQRLTDAAARELYREEEEKRTDREVPGPPSRTGEPVVTITEARQGVRGHKVSRVLGVSLVLSVIAGLVLSDWLWLYPTAFGRHFAPKETAQGVK